MPTIDITLNKPHTAIQRQMITHPGNVVAFCGRRFGKTDGYVQRLFYWMRQNPGLYWWVGLNWRSASLKRAWGEVTDIARSVLKVMGLSERDHINRSNFEVRLPGLGEIWFRTADNPPSLAGEGIHGAIIDEFSLMREIVWIEYLEATLLDYNGWAAFGGVPKGNNWAANLWRSAAGRDGWLQLHATSYDNPFIDPALIDDIKRHSAERFFKQEYLAEIIDDAGGVFRNVMACATATELQEAKPGGQYIFGVDWARSNDFTVFAVVDMLTKELVHLDRFTDIDYNIQTSRLKALYNRFRPVTIIAEYNAMGGPLVERLQADNLPVQSFVTTNATKEEIIRKLENAFENLEIKILSDPVLIGELQAYEQERLLSGWRFQAPAGMHDDMVMALALAWHGATAHTPPTGDVITTSSDIHKPKRRSNLWQR